VIDGVSSEDPIKIQLLSEKERLTILSLFFYEILQARRGDPYLDKARPNELTLSSSEFLTGH